MDTGTELANLTIKSAADITKSTAKITNETMKEFLLYLIRKAQESGNKRGETSLKKLLNSNDEIKLFDLKKQQLKEFAEQAKMFQITYSVVEEGQGKENLSILFKKSEEARLKRILENLIEKELERERDFDHQHADDKGDHLGRKTLQEKREELQPLYESQKDKQPPVKIKRKEKGGR